MNENQTTAIDRPLDEVVINHGRAVAFSRYWDMPNADTFSIPTIKGFVQKYLIKSKVSIDPFARNKRWATYTNDLNPETAAEYHMDAEDFLKMLNNKAVKADLLIFDPPYSPGQIIECYRKVGLSTATASRNGELYGRVRNNIPSVLADDAIVLSFGWNSNGMGLKHGFEIFEIMLVAHGGAHNDTICLAEKRTPREPGLFAHDL